MGSAANNAQSEYFVPRYPPAHVPFGFRDEFASFRSDRLIRSEKAEANQRALLRGI
jgi:hypothetical protein